MQTEDIKKISILDYAGSLGFTPVKKGRYYSLKEHDSVIIDTEKNKFWRNSAGVSGSVIDFAMHFEGLDVHNAMKKLALFAGGGYTPHPAETVKKTYKKTEFVLPEKAGNNNALWEYLTKTRKLDKLIVSDMLRTKNIYQDIRRNVVFVSYNRGGKADFACVRGTSQTKKFIADVPGSNYKRCFCYSNKNSTALAISESVIDSMSYMTKLKQEGKDYTQFDYLSLSGVSKYKDAVITNVREREAAGRPFEKIVIALDNDAAGIETCAKIKELLSEIGFKGEVIADLPKNAKDWNEKICKEARGGLDGIIKGAVNSSRERNNSPPMKNTYRDNERGMEN